MTLIGAVNQRRSSTTHLCRANKEERTMTARDGGRQSIVCSPPLFPMLSHFSCPLYNLAPHSCMRRQFLSASLITSSNHPPSPRNFLAIFFLFTSFTLYHRQRWWLVPPSVFLVRRLSRNCFCTSILLLHHNIFFRHHHCSIYILHTAPSTFTIDHFDHPPTRSRSVTASR